ncbi:MAG: class IV adenylate cyclase [Halobacteriota archaeon]
MYEVELKVRADHDSVRDRLDQLGVAELEETRQVDTYYDAPHRNFAETDEALRIRRETSGAGSVAKLTYKGPLVESESKTRREHETTVEDVDALGAALKSMGFEPAATVEKRRSRFEFDGYDVLLDSVSGLGEFVEVETETDEQNVESARNGAIEVVQRLGLAPDEQIRTSYLGLLLEKSAE